MRKRKVLFCNDTIGLGGIERSLCDVLRHIDYRKYNVHLYLNSSEGGFLPQIPPQVKILTPNLDGCYGKFMHVAIQLLKRRDFKDAVNSFSQIHS